MIYTLENHELKHAVEEMLFHLLPTETLSRADTAEQITEPYCRSILTEENGEAAARAIVCMDGAVHEAEKRASVTGLETLDYKRTITELVKTTVYDAVVPFLPQAPVWGDVYKRQSRQRAHWWIICAARAQNVNITFPTV